MCVCVGEYLHYVFNLCLAQWFRVLRAKLFFIFKKMLLLPVIQYLQQLFFFNGSVNYFYCRFKSHILHIVLLGLTTTLRVTRVNTLNHMLQVSFVFSFQY